MRSAQSEALGLVISCLGIIGILAGIPGLAGLLDGVWGLALGGGTLIGAFLYILATFRGGKSVLSGVVTLLLFSALTFGSTYGVMWYFMSYMPTHGGLGLELVFETPNNARNDFVSHLKAGNFDQAYANLSPEAQKQIPDADTFEKIVIENNWRPTKWKWVQEQSDNEHAEYAAETSFSGDKTGTMQVWLDKIDKHWKVSGMNFVLR